MVGDSTMRHQFLGWCQLLEGKEPELNQETPKDGYSVYVCTGHRARRKRNMVVAYLADGEGGWQGGWQSRHAYWKINSKTGLNATAMYFNGGRLALAASAAALNAASTASFSDSANSAVSLTAYCALKSLQCMTDDHCIHHRYALPAPDASTFVDHDRIRLRQLVKSRDQNPNLHE